ncbi:MAG: WYL domain-containing protein [Bacteroidales bacterium]|nr:WYL domain-containing protein [Bacteroidales bacterium]
MSIKEYIDKAIREGRDITIGYQKNDGTLSKRTISNVQYSDEFGDGYISGFCHLRQENRTFKISRIREIDGISAYEGPTTLGKTAYSTKTAYSSTKPVATTAAESTSGSKVTSAPKTASQSSISSSYSRPSTSYQPKHNPQPQPRNEGCYIATMAYGDYDHPQVLALRRFRDQKLLTTMLGRLFVRFYYAVSPQMVKVLKGHERINRTIRAMLDRYIEHIRN